jgi:hypothetical protein
LHFFGNARKTKKDGYFGHGSCHWTCFFWRKRDQKLFGKQINMNSVTIDILFKYKEAGENALKKIEKYLSSGKIQKELQQTVNTAGNNINSAFQNIKLDPFKKSLDSIASSLNFVVRGIKSFSLEANKALDSTIAKTRTQETIIKESASRAIGLSAVLAGFTFFSIKNLDPAFLTLKGITSELGKLPALGKIAFDSLKLNALSYFNLFKSVIFPFTAEGLMSLSNNFLSVFRTVFSSLAGGVGGFFLSRFLFSDALTFFKRILGYSRELSSPLARIARFFTTIDSALHSTSRAFADFFRMVVFGAGAWAGLWNPILAGFAIGKNFIDFTTKKVSFWLADVSGRFGAVRGQISTIFYGFRTFFFELAKMDGLLGALSGKSFWSNIKMFFGFSGKQTIIDKLTASIKAGSFERFFKQILELPKTIEMAMIKASSVSNRWMVAPLGNLKDIFFKIDTLIQKINSIAAVFQALISTASIRINALLAMIFLKVEELIQKINSIAVVFQTLVANSYTKINLVLVDISQKIVDFPKLIDPFFEKTNRWLVEISAKIDDLIKKINSIVGVVSSASNVVAQTIKTKFFDSIERLNFFELFQKKVFGAIGDRKALGGFDNAFRDLFKSMDTQIKSGAPGLKTKPFVTFFKNVFNLSPENINLVKTDIEIFVVEMQKLLGNVLQKTGAKPKGTNFASQLVSTISMGLRKTADPELKVAAATILNSLRSLLEKGLGNFSASGAAIPKTIAYGIKSNSKEMEKAINDLLRQISPYLPASDAQIGPLSRLSYSGSMIPGMLAVGMKKGIGEVTKATSIVAEKIAGFFPRSLPIFGALVQLPLMGFKIPFYIAQGILSGAKLAYSALQKMVNELKSIFDGLITKIRELRRISLFSEMSIEKTSALDYALRSLGGSVQDVSYGFMRMSELLQKASEEDRRTLALWNIDIKEVKKSSDPLLTLFLELVDVVNKYGASSASGIEAMKMMGQTAQSNLLPVIKSGSSAIKDLMKSFIDSKTTIKKESDEYVKIADRISTAWLGAKEAIVQEFIIPLVPILKENFEKINDLWQKNSLKILGAARIIGDAVSSLLNFMLEFVSMAIKEPKKAINIVYDIFSTVTTYILTEGAIFADKAFLKILGFLIRIQTAILSITLVALKQFASIVLREISKPFDGVMNKIQEIRNTFGFSGNISKILDEMEGKKGTAFVDGLSAGDLGPMGTLSTEKIFQGEKGAKGTTESITKDVISSVKSMIPEMKKELDELFKDFKLVQEDIFTDEYIKEQKDRFLKTVKELGIASEQATPELKAAVQKVLESFDPEIIAEKMRKISEEAERSIEDGKEKVVNALKSMKDEVSEHMKDIAHEFKSFSVVIEDPKEKMDQMDEALKRTNENLAHLGNGFSALESAISNMYDATGKKMRAFFYFQRALAMATAVINIAKGITQALGAKGIWGVFEGAAIAAAGAIQLGVIAGQTIKGYARGGFVSGEKGVDRVPAMLSHNEYVQPTDSVNYYGVEFMEAIRKRLIPREALSFMVGNLSRPLAVASGVNGRYNTGGIVSSDNAVHSQPLTIVNYYDKQEFGEFMASNPGKNIIINTIKSNAGQIKKYLI